MTATTRPATATAPIYPVLPASNLSRAEQFYRETLGMEIEKPSGAAGQFMAHAGGDSWVLVYETGSPAGSATAATFMVEDLPHVVSDLRDRGVTFEEYDMPGLKTVDGIAEMSGERSAWFKDTEGNTLAIGEMLR